MKLVGKIEKRFLTYTLILNYLDQIEQDCITSDVYYDEDIFYIETYDYYKVIVKIYAN